MLQQLDDSKEGSPPTCSSFPCATYDPPLLLYFEVNTGVWSFLDYGDIYLLVALFAFLEIFDPNLLLLLLHTYTFLLLHNRLITCASILRAVRATKKSSFDVKNARHLTSRILLISLFTSAISTRQGISLLRVSNRITHDVQPHTSQQLHSVQQLTLILTIVLYFEYCFQKPITTPRWTPADAASLFHTQVAAILG